MRSDKGAVDPPATGSSVWTIFGWLSFALPLVLYTALRLS